MAYVLTEHDQSIIDAYEKALTIYRSGSGKYRECLDQMIDVLTIVDVLDMIAVSCERRADNVRKYGAGL